MESQIQKRGYAAPVDVLVDIGMLAPKDLETWRRGQVPYLEGVCNGNLSKLSFALKQMSSYAHAHGLVSSRTRYTLWGAKKGHTKKELRFSKSGSAPIEARYSTHFVARREPPES